jgi:O-antigen/teichoic acid export membrane protein
MPFELIASATSAAILPFFYRTATEESEDASKSIFATVAAYDTALFAFLGLGTILFAREVILVFATAVYLDAEAVVPFVVWASIFRVLAQVPARGIYLVKQTGPLAAAFLTPVLVNIVLNLVLIPPYGMMGAAWATLLAYPTMFGLTLWLAQRFYPIPYDYLRIAKPLAIALTLSLLKDAATTESMLLTVASKTAILAIFPVALLASGFVTLEERRALRRALRRSALRPSPRPRGSGTESEHVRTP